jgi:cytidine deaminase
MENEIWKKLYTEAKKVLNPRSISDSVEAGGVAAALLTKNGNIYTGVCIDTACSLGFCAERNAIGTMITNGENEVIKLLCIGSHDDNIMMPCGACRELLLQICDNNKNMKIITDLNTFDTVKLVDLMPKYWK